MEKPIASNAVERFRSELDCALQPIASAESGDIVGYEVLMRNFHKLGCSEPKEVFNLAASLDLIFELECILRENALRKFSAVPGAAQSKLFMNLDFRMEPVGDALLEYINELLASSEVSPANICFELPEHQCSEKKNTMGQYAEKARLFGYSMAVDDFGSGFSQMKWLYDYELDFVKIDRFFISDIHKDSKKRVFVNSLVDLAHFLGIQVVAEGVETQDEFKICKKCGCDLIQGYLFARPEVNLEKIGQFNHWDLLQKEERSEKDQLNSKFLLSQVQRLETVPDTSSMINVLEIFRNHKQRVIPIVNKLNEPLGVIQEREVISYLYMPFGQDSLVSQPHKNTLLDLMRDCPTSDVKVPIRSVIDMKGNMLDDGLIVTRDGKYYGFLPPCALFQISNEIRMEAVEDIKPLSRLPGSISIDNEVDNNRHYRKTA